MILGRPRAISGASLARLIMILAVLVLAFANSLLLLGPASTDPVAPAEQTAVAAPTAAPTEPPPLAEVPAVAPDEVTPDPELSPSPAPVDAAAAAIAAGQPVFRRWAAVNEAPALVVSREEALADARSFDVLTALPWTYRQHITVMREANPDLRVLVYLNGTYAQQGERQRIPDEWLAIGANGEPVRSLRFGNWLIEPTLEAWRADRAAECRRLLEESGYDGCFLDDLGTGPLFPEVVSSVPVNPATAMPYTTSEWLEATAALAADVRARLGDVEVYGNGLGDGQRFARASAEAESLLAALDGGIAETWLRNARSPLDAWPSVEEWAADVQLVIRAEQQGQRVLLLTKTWGPGDPALRAQWHRFAVGTFLLGAGERSLLAFSAEPPGDPTVMLDDAAAADLGAPLASLRQAGATYMRDFSNGVVVVNPTADAHDVTVAAGEPPLRIGPFDSLVVLS